MALSNILREPRREITETVAGAAIVSIVLFGGVYGDYLLACGWRWLAPSMFEDTGDLIFCMVIIPMLLFGGAMLLFLVFLVIHAAGEGICDAIERRGIQVRPRQRY